MFASFDINSTLKSYQVSIVNGLLEDNEYDPGHDFVLIDQLVLELYPELNSNKIIPIPAVEDCKSLETVAEVVERLRALGANRSSRLIAVGGGIIQDIATFVASVYMRGIAWSYYPTTLLGMVDSCIGGKSSINVGAYKNIAGNFYPPDEVIVDTQFTKTLRKEEFIAGLSEAVKICFASGGSEFDSYLKLTNQSQHIDLDVDALLEVIHLTLTTKKRFIEEDEFDEGIRLLLNFGHTFGHAIEAASDFYITHGVAVGLGMQMACKFSEQYGMGLSERANRLNEYLSELMKEVPNLPNNLKLIDSKVFLNKFSSDKKHTEKDYVMILPGMRGFLERAAINKSTEVEVKLLDSFEFVRELYEVQ